MPKRGPDDPGTRLEPGAVVSAPYETGFSLQVPEAGLDRSLVRGDEELLDRSWCQCVEQADTLGRRKRQIPAG